MIRPYVRYHNVGYGFAYPTLREMLFASRTLGGGLLCGNNGPSALKVTTLRTTPFPSAATVVACLVFIRQIPVSAPAFIRRCRRPSSGLPSRLECQPQPAPTVHLCRKCRRLRPIAGRCRPSKPASTRQGH